MGERSVLQIFVVRENILSNEAIHEYIDSIQILLAEPATRNFSKWPELGVTDYDFFVEEIHTFIDQRLSWIDETLAIDFVDAPDASFTPEPISGLTYLFTPVINGANYYWDFGDGSTSTLQNPIHTFTADGIFEVSLLIDQYYGCTSVATQLIEIEFSFIQNISNIYSIYPIPFSDNITVELPENYSNVEISVIDNFGQIQNTQMFNNSGNLLIST